ncbi:phytanoyl-CoA dioxygenase family protein [Paenibacillus sp. ATY16]|uniref:phytanoyl-CoA dioxygenase family protein n=1 Tax=Paenibacillus sp. ATY16 TaxID=1759312 RepID=UPI00200EB211|nr:phytanoyl-CoA dioxygenase family protein [Paenibacillus sp. ATY16]MCK9861085.1 phytanoyl-CoA dioxygenase family protein [Paenibacillus sp. ATY16]
MITQNDVEFYKENGYLLVQGLFSQQEVEDMRKAIDGILNRAAQSKFDTNHTWQGEYLPPEQLKKLVLKGFHDVQYHDAAFMRAAIHPNMAAVLSQLIGPNVQLHHSKMLVKPPENGAAFPLHQDAPYFPHASHTMLAASVHLDDADMENGCLCVIPGTHKNGMMPHVGRHYLDHREYPISMATPCPAKAGDVLFFNYLTVHGSDVNRSTRNRRNVLFQYRDPMDVPTLDTHVNWGQGLMICGENPIYREYHANHTLQAK